MLRMKVWKKAVMVQSQNLPRDFEEYHEETQVSFKPSNASVNHYHNIIILCLSRHGPKMIYTMILLNRGTQ
jgi:quercetin dioxygenase-like cupin family protein